MEILTSNFLPLKLKHRTFADSFSELIIKSDYMQIASGYISTESITEIKSIIESNRRPRLDLLIGMHFFDGITRTQYEAALYLNDFLIKENMGSVSVANTFRFHGKLYSFSSNNNIIAGVIGSSNLDNILNFHRSYETDLLVTDQKTSKEISDIIRDARSRIASPITDWIPDKFIEKNKLLDGQDSVSKISLTQLSSIRKKTTGVTFDIPLKATDAHLRSNLNVYFGKGRENKNTGFIKPRHWYEVELIVPSKITENQNYPKAGYPDKESIITVYTDDGWKFECKISGDYSKNFRSNGDLKILGKWIKGRLENNGALKVGEPVTDDVLKKYGRNSFRLTATDDPKIWMLDFGV